MRLNKREQREDTSGRWRWLITYADMVSLLLGFFVLLYGFSSMDQAKFKAVSESLKDAFGISRTAIIPDTDNTLPQSMPANVSELLATFKTAVQPIVSQNGFELEEGSDRITIRIRDDVLFEPRGIRLKDEIRPVLAEIRRVLERLPGEVVTSGHTDSAFVPDAQWPSDWALSAARAAMVLDFLLDKSSIPHQKAYAVGYGSSRPKFLDDTPEHMARNRRVDIAFIPSQKEGLRVVPLAQ
ncbi:MAG: flagellar motor protein MotB [Deltaproteobacteria bacterium]|nr:flagellar motor protein MotB [Deltaproteobacteria bacterium]